MQALLERSGFFGDAQKDALARLRAEMGVTTGHFRQVGRRHEALGLHIGFKPAADWVGQETE